MKPKPVPDHPDLVVPFCDESMLEMVGNKAMYVKAVDKSLTQIQRHSLDVMGSLAQAWKTLHKHKKNKGMVP